MRDRALQILDEQGTFDVIEFLACSPDSLESTRTFLEIVRHLYWKQKDLQRTVVMAQAGIQFGLTAAILANDQDAERVAEIRGVAKGLAYDLASFTWPGWDEPGIEISPAYLAWGREAARLNLRLARELNKGDLPMSRAFWLLGAHCLVEGEFESANRHFAEAKGYAETADTAVGARLHQGYECLAAVLQTPGDTRHAADFHRLQEELAAMPEGADCAAQLQTAWRVFGDGRSIL